MKVANLGYSKQVGLRMNLSGTWRDECLSWSRNFGDYDLFDRRDAPFTYELAVRYQVNGQEHWDNNGGSNYALRQSGVGGNTVGGNVALENATVRGGRGSDAYIEGEVWVNRLAYHKYVGIRLSADSGITWQDIAATYDRPITESLYETTLPGVEAWRFRTGMNGIQGGRFHFAAFYNDLSNGQWYWDSNFGRNYQMNKTPGSSLG
ncbi:hypothetical protein [Pseudonocardia cypriaca]|uniref:hypothetical protein n=1 Tax=Pseudonocardia cypriaca TaxID=882449 RepID=UPI001B886BBA|nr:hypothetical protein [Pseudonocardia cypriaca]